MIRQRERRGEKELRGTGCERSSRILERVVGWKLAVELRFVMRSVLDGGDGVIRGGREDRSRERGVWVPFDRGEGDGEGEEMGGEMAAIFLCRWDVLIVVQCE